MRKLCKNVAVHMKMETYSGMYSIGLNVMSKNKGHWI